MDQEAYIRYSEESDSWLHRGRKELIRRALNWHIPSELSSPMEILDVGAGVGQNIQVFKPFGVVDAIEIDPIGIEKLKKLDGVRDIFERNVPFELSRTYDIIGAFDVIEHIKDDRAAVQWILERLKPGGIFIATVPAFQWLFSSHDKALGHYRRYSASEFNALIPKKYALLSASYFNSLLFPAAFLTRAIWQFKQLFSSRKLEKQHVPHDGWLNTILNRILQLDVSTMKPCSNRWFGLSYFVCVRKV